MKKILLIGDSIRHGYDKYIKMCFKGVADVRYPDENCRFTTYIIRNLFDWKRTLYQEGESVDLIHWNAGLWDDLRMLDGEPLVSLEEYERNVERIYRLLALHFPGAKIAFATSTPVREELFGDYKRYNRDTEAYNAVAVRIAKAHGADVNDLYGLMSGMPISYHSDQTHYYTKEGTRVITEQVKACIEKNLGICGQELDYDALFSKTDDIGI